MVNNASLLTSRSSMV